MKLFVAFVLICNLMLSVSATGAAVQGPIVDWVILGPFPNPERDPKSKSRGAFDVDYLKSLGGEAKARIARGKVVTATGPDGKKLSVTSQKIVSPARSFDFRLLSPDNHHKLAYAYSEMKSSKDVEMYFFIGTDDGAKVWINGKIVYEFFQPKGRGFIPREDRFRARFKKGVNTVLIKVENTVGGWEFGIEGYDKPHFQKREAEIKQEESKSAMMGQEFTLSKQYPGYVVGPGDDTPIIIWRDADFVRRVVGEIPLRVRWFDSKLNEVKGPSTVGRYAAYIEGKMKDGTPVKRAKTFYCAPDELRVWDNDFGLAIPYLSKPIDPEVWKSQSAFISEQAGNVYRDFVCSTEDGAKLLAGLSELKAKGITGNGVTDSPEVLNDDFQLALKLKLAGLTKKAHPLDQPTLRSTPARILHEGTVQEAGVKPDAKEKIDAVCREWAKDSGEPFTILVARRGVIISHAAFGNAPDGKPIDVGYRKGIASITKAITGMLFSQFLDQGLVELDDPIGKVMPDFPTRGGRALTFRHLFTHTSGLSGHGEWGGIHNPYLDNVIRNGLDSLHPGAAHNYNGMGYDLAGKAMEMMTGKSIIRLFHENLYRPLGIQNVQMDDLAYGAKPTAFELGILAQWLANHGSYGDKQFISEETFQKLLPTNLSRYFKGIDVEWGIGLVRYTEQKPGTPPGSKDPQDMMFGMNVIGHGSASSCILRVDLDHDLVIVLVRRTAGEKFGEYQQRFFTAVSDCLL